MQISDSTSSIDFQSLEISASDPQPGYFSRIFRVVDAVCSAWRGDDSLVEQEMQNSSNLGAARQIQELKDPSSDSLSDESVQEPSSLNDSENVPQGLPNSSGSGDDGDEALNLSQAPLPADDGQSLEDADSQSHDQAIEPGQLSVDMQDSEEFSAQSVEEESVDNAQQNQLPGEPSNFMMLITAAMTIKKYAIPIIMGLACAITLGIALTTSVATAGAATPLMLALLGSMFCGISALSATHIAVYDYEKERQIHELQEQLVKAKKAKSEVKPLAAVRNEIEEISKRLKIQQKKLNKLNQIKNSGVQLTANQKSEVESLTQEITRFEELLKKRKKWMKKLEAEKQAENSANSPHSSNASSSSGSSQD